MGDSPPTPDASFDAQIARFRSAVVARTVMARMADEGNPNDPDAVISHTRTRAYEIVTETSNTIGGRGWEVREATVRQGARIVRVNAWSAPELPPASHTLLIRRAQSALRKNWAQVAWAIPFRTDLAAANPASRILPTPSGLALPPLQVKQRKTCRIAARCPTRLYQRRLPRNGAVEVGFTSEIARFRTNRIAKTVMGRIADEGNPNDPNGVTRHTRSKRYEIVAVSYNSVESVDGRTLEIREVTVRSGSRVVLVSAYTRLDPSTIDSGNLIRKAKSALRMNWAKVPLATPAR